MTCSNDSTHSTQHSPYQFSEPNRPHGNPDLLHSLTQLCWCSWRIIHVTSMNRHLVPEVFYGVHIRIFGWQIHDFHVLILQWQYLGPGQCCSGRWLWLLSYTLNKCDIYIYIYIYIQAVIMHFDSYQASKREPMLSNYNIASLFDTFTRPIWSEF